MIKRALEYIAGELEFGLGLTTSEVSLNKLQHFTDEGAQGLIISLLNVEEESTLKNTPHYVRKNNQLFYKEPPVYLNLNLLMAFEFGSYGTSLLHLSETVKFFQNRKWFSAEGQRPANPFPSDMDKLNIELQQLSFEQLNHIWSISGGVQYPSLLYKTRLVKIQPQDEIKGHEIDTIQVDTGLT